MILLFCRYILYILIGLGSVKSMVIVPLIVKSQEELEKALKLKRDVILINNRSVYEKVTEQKKRYARRKTVKKIGVLGGAALVISSLVCPPAVGLYAFMGGAVSIVSGGTIGIAPSIEKQLKKYTVQLDEEKKILLLINEKSIEAKTVDGQYCIEGYDNIIDPKTIKPVCVNTKEEFDFYTHQEVECIVSGTDYYVKCKTQNRRAPIERNYQTYDSKKNNMFILVHFTKCDLNVCKIEGIDMNSILLE